MGPVSYGDLNEVNRLVVVGSVDGVTAASGFMRVLNKSGIKIDFTEAHRVWELKPKDWDPCTKVGFIDLGVNNDGKKKTDRREGDKDPKELTINFVNEIKAAGHEIIFIADEHNSKKWEKVFVRCELNFELLVIKPKNRSNAYPSSCSILQEAFENKLDKAASDLFDAGTQADLLSRGKETALGEIFRKAMKSQIRDDSRRDYLARHFSRNTEPDEHILGWIGEYEEMENNLNAILATKEDLGNNMMRYDVGNLKHDATEFFKNAYAISPVVILVNTMVFINNKLQPGVSIAVDNSKEGYKDLDVLKTLKTRSIPASGFQAKANFSSEYIDAATDAMRECVKGF